MPTIHLKSFLEWIPVAENLPKRDVPVIVAVTNGRQTFTTVSHRMSRGWSGIKTPATVTHYSALPKCPHFIEQ
jgi:hypothetical protein